MTKDEQIAHLRARIEKLCQALKNRRIYIKDLEAKLRITEKLTEKELQMKHGLLYQTRLHNGKFRK